MQKSVNRYILNRDMVQCILHKYDKKGQVLSAGFDKHFVKERI